jgi:hypothetical protein
LFRDCHAGLDQAVEVFEVCNISIYSGETLIDCP